MISYRHIMYYTTRFVQRVHIRYNLIESTRSFSKHVNSIKLSTITIHHCLWKKKDFMQFCGSALYIILECHSPKCIGQFQWLLWWNRCFVYPECKLYSYPCFSIVPTIPAGCYPCHLSPELASTFCIVPTIHWLILRRLSNQATDSFHRQLWPWLSLWKIKKNILYYLSRFIAGNHRLNLLNYLFPTWVAHDRDAMISADLIL